MAYLRSLLAAPSTPDAAASAVSVRLALAGGCGGEHKSDCMRGKSWPQAWGG